MSYEKEIKKYEAKTKPTPLPIHLKKLEAVKKGVQGVEAPNTIPPVPSVAKSPTAKPLPKPLPKPVRVASLSSSGSTKLDNTQLGGKPSVSGFSVKAQSSEVNPLPQPLPPKPLPTSPATSTPSTTSTTRVIEENPQQAKAVELALSGKSFVLTGAAGTGKTFTVHDILEQLLARDHFTRVADLRDASGGSNACVSGYNVAICGYTNRAVDNMASTLRTRKPDLYEELAVNLLTAHKLCRVAPEEVINPKTGKLGMQMLPRHGATNLLPVRTIILEEASNVSLDLWKWVYTAMQEGTQVIFLGDINQLPPVYGDSILMEALNELPIVELTKVYRQALESPIIMAAHGVKDGHFNSVGKATELDGFDWIGKDAKLVGAGRFANGVRQVIQHLHEKGDYDPSTDMVLSPFNKHEAGTDALNLAIASHLDEVEDTRPLMYEIKAGIETKYLRQGDRLFVDAHKCEGIIEEITPNPVYMGKMTQKPSRTLDRTGLDLEQDVFSELDDLDALDFTIQVPDIEDGKDDEDTFRQASHILTVLLETGERVDLASAGEVSGCKLGYVLTGHKAQGCQWRNVIVVAHQSHSVAINREWLYTAFTRAEEGLYLVASKSVIQKGLTKQRCKGDSIEEKVAAYATKEKGMKKGVNMEYVRVGLVK